MFAIPLVPQAKVRLDQSMPWGCGPGPDKNLRVIAIDLDIHAGLRLDGLAIDAGQMTSLLHEALTNPSDHVRAELRVGDGVYYGVVVETLAQMRNAGLPSSQIALLDGFDYW